MYRYCYHCGAPASDGRFCERCGADLQPPTDVFCNAQTCDDYDCGADVPRWSRFCPICGKPIWQYDPKNIEYMQQRHKGLLLGALVWAAIAFILAFVLTLIDDEIPLKLTLIIAAVLSVLTWIVCFARFERGKTINGTILRHWTEETTESVVVPDEKNILGHRLFEQRPVTKYKTEIRWDDGKTHVTVMDNCAANHIQLAPGDRIRKYKSTGEFIKL